MNSGKLLATHLNAILKNLKSSTQSDNLKMQHFLEATHFRGQEFGKIIKAAVLSKRAGGRYKTSKVVSFFQNNCYNCWSQRYFILSDEGIGYSPSFESTFLSDNLFFDTTLRVQYGETTKREKLQINIITSSRKLKVKARTCQELYDWVNSIVDSINNSRYCKINRFQSFCPVTRSNYAKWYINGHEYYSDVADELEKAEDRIFITDWWLSPELYLKRPISVTSNGLNTQWRLDSVLKRAAERGVKIYVLLYKEFDHALPNDSAYSRQTLMGLHKNIEVLRHPGDLIFLWSHHEKLCCIDNTVTFMGGLDLCFGRWDTDQYWLSDPGDEEHSLFFPGQDYSNVRIKDFSDVKQYDKTLISKSNCPRMPWRDIAVCLRGQIVRDTARHFIQYWNFAKEDLTNEDGRLAKGVKYRRKTQMQSKDQREERSLTSDIDLMPVSRKSEEPIKGKRVDSTIIEDLPPEHKSKNSFKEVFELKSQMEKSAINTDVVIEKSGFERTNSAISKFIKAVAAQSKEARYSFVIKYWRLSRNRVHFRSH